MTTNDQDAGFHDPTELTRWTKVAVYASMAVALVSVWRDVRDLLGNGSEGPATGLLAIAILGVLAMIVTSLIIAIVVLNWIHLANRNARQLGAADMRFTPGWAVGWYFVPIAWFWKPYQAMKEIWQASSDPADWAGQPVSPLLHWWWFLWIVPWGVSAVDWAVGRTLDEAGAETLTATTGLVSDLLDFPLALVLLAIINRVHGMQMAHYSRQIAAGGA